ncbi:TIM barrel protein [Chelativorans sp. YIM 93263]|uniref:TIM barrel protein n=1 Tax=Chelativorans sp. YIM 93263 TaxID=2906648 RepID=UPI002378E39D|nr:TIM barrel protein [Chelativorans sp. YIM 93263]
MTAGTPAFALNHMCAPNHSISDFFDLAKAVGATGVEIRNDIQGNAIADGTDPEAIAEAAASRGLRIVSINALQRFNQWNDARENEARALAAYAKACGAEALVLVPVNDGTGSANGERQANLRIALKELRPILAEAGIAGLVEPLGFDTSSLRYKSEAIEAIEGLGASAVFRIVHDTFHHFLSGEESIFPAQTGLLHASGVTDSAIGVNQMCDGDRVLVGRGDRLDNIVQIAALRRGGFNGPLSFEPFSEAVHRLPDLASTIADSMTFITEGMRQLA